MKISQEHQALLTVTTKLVNYIEDHNVEDDFDAESGDKWRSSGFDEVIKATKDVLVLHDIIALATLKASQ